MFERKFAGERLEASIKGTSGKKTGKIRYKGIQSSGQDYRAAVARLCPIS